MQPVFKTFSTLNSYYVYDRNTNSIICIGMSDYTLLQKIEHGEKSDEAIEALNRFRGKGYLHDSVIETIKQPCSDCFEEYINRKTEKITLQVTQNCNLRCDYCAYTGSYHNRMFSEQNMSFETAKKAIDYLFAHSCEKSRVVIAFYGGEPLLRMDLIKKCVAYVDEYYSEKPVYYTLTTNGTLLTDSVIEYLFAHDINIMISLDGTKEMHDRHRKYPDGSGSFDHIMCNLKRIQENYPNYYQKISINTVLSPSNDLGCIKDFYDADATISFYKPKYTLLSEFNAKEPVRYGEDYWISSRVERLKALLWIIGKIDESEVSSLFKQDLAVYQQTAEHLSPIASLPKKCHPSGPCMAGIKRLFSDVNGNLFPCERVSEESETMRIGNLDSGIDIEKVRQLINIGEISEDACKFCWAFVHCTQCAAAADNLGTLSKEKRLAMCPRVKSTILERFKDYCFLRELGITFENL